MSKYGVIIIGGHVQGLGIARVYGSHDIPVIVLDTTSINLAKHSKYCTEFIKYKEGHLLTKLRSLAKEGIYKNWLLMPTNDRHVGILGEYKEELSSYYKVSTVNDKVLQYFFNKRDTYKLAEDLKVDIPKTWFADSYEELQKLEITYPCIIKPAIMHTFYSQTKKKVFICKNDEDLKNNYFKALEIIPKNEVIIQDIIPGNSEHQYSVCFMFDGEKPLVTMSARRARQHPPDFGNATTYAETVSIPNVVNQAKTILNSVGFVGVCEVEFKYDVRDDTYKFLEVNPRTWKWHSLAEKTNSPILMSLYNYMYKLDPIIKNEQENASFRHLMTDIPTIIKMRLNKINYTKTQKPVKYAVWNKNDLAPSFFEILYVPFFILKR